MADFDAIYGISGGAYCFWLYCVQEVSSFPERSHEFGGIASETLGVFKHLGRTGRHSHFYETAQQVRNLGTYVPQNEIDRSFDEFRLKNFNALVVDDASGKWRLLCAAGSPELSVAKSVGSGIYPRRLLKTPLVAPLPEAGYQFSDFAFGGDSNKSEFRDYLNKSHAGRHIIHINIHKDKGSGNTSYIRVCQDRFPKLGQILDLSAAVLGIDTPRCAKAFAAD